MTAGGPWIKRRVKPSRAKSARAGRNAALGRFASLGRAAQTTFLDASGTAVVAVAEQGPKKPRKRRRGVSLGRPASPARLGFVPHVARAHHDHRHPVHVSMRRVKNAPSLRSERVYRAILSQLVRVKSKGVQVVHFSIQSDHLHLIVEGEHREDVSKQMQKLFSRIALAVNYVAQRRGKLFRDRHHREELKSPTQTRNALVYVLFNDRKHHAQNGGALTEATLRDLDDKSSVAWLNGWSEQARPPPELVAKLRALAMAETGEAPVSEATTWLASVGWRQRGGGAVTLHELPRFLRR